MSNIEYVIYCRKSSDETTDNQKQSIPDQIKACIGYMEREWIKLKEKPKDFSMFESLAELHKEDKEEDIHNRRIYQDTRHLYIIKEQESWKIPWKRKKWTHLISLIKAWKINWILSYSPDRQSRNMLEWGQIIDLIDQNKLKENRLKNKIVLDLKYTNFQFQDNAAGKMMLGIWFVFSKQYSDKLGEDITRWSWNKVTWWKWIWRHKPWYFINDKWFHQPHPKYFPLIKEAFEMKLNWEPETIILSFLNANWYVREYIKSWDKRPISKSSLNVLFKDEFNYGVFINWEFSTDLRKENEYYEPIITEEEYQILQDRYYSNPITKAKSITKDIYEDIKAFDNDFIISEDDYHFTFSLPSSWRYKKKIEEANKKWIRLRFADVVQSHQIQYICANSSSKQHKLSFSLSDIDNAILEALKYFKVNKEAFNEYVGFVNTKLDNINQTKKEKITSKNLQIWRIDTEKKRYIQKNMSIDMDKEERKIYNDTKINYETKIKFLRKEIENLDEWERNDILELEVFMEVLNKAEEYYKKASFVQKGKIAKILFLNIKINSKKELKIQLKPELKTLFNPIWWS